MRRGERVVARIGEGTTWFCGELKDAIAGFYIVRPFGNSYTDDRLCREVHPLNGDTWQLIGTTNPARGITE